MLPKDFKRFLLTTLPPCALEHSAKFWGAMKGVRLKQYPVVVINSGGGIAVYDFVCCSTKIGLQLSAKHPQLLPITQFSKVTRRRIKQYVDVNDYRREEWAARGDMPELTSKSYKGNSKQGILCKHTNQKLTTYIAKLLGHGGQGGNVIRDMGVAIINELFGEERFKLVNCKTVEDYIEMYHTHSYSCMGIHNRHTSEYNTYLREYMLKTQKLWPSIWYKFNPHTAGVYLQDKKTGRPVARTMLLRTKTDEDFKHFYAGVRGESDIYEAILEKKLTALGHTRQSKMHITESFEVPAYFINKEKQAAIVPIPYHDEIYVPYRVAYLREKNCFVFGASPSKLRQDGYMLTNTHEIQTDIDKGWVGVDLKTGKKLSKAALHTHCGDFKYTVPKSN